MVRFALVATLLFGFTAPVLAQDFLDSVELPVHLLHAPAVPSVAPPARPQVLLPLYVSFSVLQMMDVHSTNRALDRGGVESNPLMKGFVGNNASLIAVKAGGTAVAIYAAERLWRRNRAASIGLMIAANTGITWVVQHNYRVVR
jgi:hypothetical protein